MYCWLFCVREKYFDKHFSNTLTKSNSFQSSIKIKANVSLLFAKSRIIYNTTSSQNLLNCGVLDFREPNKAPKLYLWSQHTKIITLTPWNKIIISIFVTLSYKLNYVKTPVVLFVPEVISLQLTYQIELLCTLVPCAILWPPHPQ